MQVRKLFDHIHTKILGQDLLATASKVDANANGVQVWGSVDVKKIALGVSCNVEFLEKASQWEADVCIFHHGIGLNSKHIYNSQLDMSHQQQLRHIFQGDLTIAGYHYALDAHETLGNNAQIIKHLGAQQTKLRYGELGGACWGWVAQFEQPRFVQALANDCSKLFKHDVFMVLGGPEKIKRIGVVSGGGIPDGAMLMELYDKQIDLHLTGEIKESSPAKAKESGFNYFACGHYATEVFGVKALGQEIQKAFPQMEVQFIEVWNEL